MVSAQTWWGEIEGVRTFCEQGGQLLRITILCERLLRSTPRYFCILLENVL